MTAPIRSEEDIVQGYLAPLAAGFAGALGLADDCAVIAPAPGSELVLKTDPIVAGLHFLPDDPPEDIAWKALAVNVSDLAAKGASPRAYLMALAFPDTPEPAWMARFAAGLAEAQVAFSIHLAGGDTDRRPGPLTISITVLGEVPAGRMIPRGGARAGDALVVSGTLGSAALGLALAKDPGLIRAWGLTDSEARGLVARYRRPAPRLVLRDALRGFAHAAMDLSDGLAKDLDRMARASGVAARVRLADLPLDAAVQRILTADPARAESVVAGGDDYEVLAAVAPDAVAPMQAAAAAVGLPLTLIGHVLPGSGIVIEGRDGAALALTRMGWDHF